MAGSTVTPAIMQVAVPIAMTNPRLEMPRCCATIRLPKPAMVFRPDTSTALPVLRARTAGVR